MAGITAAMHDAWVSGREIGEGLVRASAGMLHPEERLPPAQKGSES
jgi:hypothetical protein